MTKQNIQTEYKEICYWWVVEGSTKIRSDRATNLVFGHKER